MSERTFPETLIPPSINDARSRALLKAFEFAARQLDFSQLLKRNEPEMSPEDLSLALHDLSMNEFVPPDGLPENAARNLIASSWPLQEKKGTDEGVKIGLAALGLEAEIVHWWQEEPRAQHDTHVIGIELDFSLIGQISALIRATGKMVEETKRWSQGSGIELRLGGEADLRLGASGAGLASAEACGGYSPSGELRMGIGAAALGQIIVEARVA